MGDRPIYEDFRDVLSGMLHDQYGITTTRYHGRPYREPCHLIHQGNLERRRPGGRLPECHPNFGKSDRDFEGDVDECALAPDMPTALDVGVDHRDAWWRGSRMVAWVWYPYETPLDRLGEAHERAARHGLTLSLSTGWGIHLYGGTPAVILSLGEPPSVPRTEEVFDAVCQLRSRVKQ